MSKKKSCSIGPTINGEISKLYLGLRKLIGDAKVTNYIYSVYTQLGVAEKMNADGYKVGKQKQHDSKDVYKYLGVASILDGMDEVSIRRAKRALGAVDENDIPVRFSNPKEALSKVNDFNKTSKSLVATVVQSGNDYIISVKGKNSSTQYKTVEMIKQGSSWKVLEQALSNVGINLDELITNPNIGKILNATSLNRSIELLKGLNNTKNEYLSKDIIELLLTLYKDTDQAKKIFNKWGSIEEAALKIKESFFDSENVSNLEKLLINSFLSNAKKLSNLDLDAILEQLNTIKNDQFADTEESKIEEGIAELKKIPNIDIDPLVLENRKISNISQAIGHAIFTLERELSDLYRYSPDKEEEKEKLEEKILQLTKAITSKSYYNSTVVFLGEALTRVQELTERMPTESTTPTFNTVLEKIKYKATYLNDAKSTLEGYEFIIKALTNIDNLTDTEELSEEDKHSIKEIANSVLSEFEKFKNRVNIVKEDTAIEAFTEILGDSIPNGVAISSIISQMRDSAIYDILYSIGRASNPLVNAVGSIIRNAQDERTARFNEIKRKIRRLNNNLKKAGITSTEFMYENGKYVRRIISDIDWDAYIRARNKAKEEFKKQGLKGNDLDAAMRRFTDDNTEEIPVHRAPDGTVIRTERIPNTSYRKEHNPIDDLNDAQKTYYYEMMALKAELETLMPDYARDLYFPPQVRRDFLDIVKGPVKDIPKNLVKALLTKLKDWVVWREDDTDLGGGAYDVNNDWIIVKGTMRDSIRKEIPVHYKMAIKDQGELLTDFSSALIHLANTSINYDCMSDVAGTAEFLADFIKDLTPKSTYKGKLTAEIIERSGMRAFKFLQKEAKATNNSALLDGWLDMHLYGVKLKDKGKFSKLAKSLIRYESIRALAINLKGMTVNLSVGEMQTLMEAGAGEFFNMKDYLWAKGHLLSSTAGMPGRLVDYLNHNKNNYDVLIAELFEPIPGSFSDNSMERFHDSKIRTALESFNPLVGYSLGERILFYTTMYAMLHNTKILIDGKKSTLYEAFDKIKESGNSELVLKDNITDLEGNPITMDYIENMKKKIRLANQTMHGSMNQEDKGIITQHLIGRAVMQFRQWMVESYSRRFRSEFRDASTGLLREGYYITTFKYLKNFITQENHGKLSERDKFNLRRARTEMLILISLTLLSLAIGEADDENENDFWYRMFIYNVNKTMADVLSTTPIGAPRSGTQVIQSLIPVTNTLEGFLYPIYGIKDAFDEYERGEYKGENKYKINLLRKTVPFWNQIEKMKRFATDDRQVNVSNY